MPNPLPLRRIPFLLLAGVSTAASLTASDIVWQAGEDEDPFASGYNPRDEFAAAEYSNNLAPGNVTRVPEDPLYNAGSNPSSDDDFYFAGTYPAGFNGLGTDLVVGLDEALNAFSRHLHTSSRTNRIHFQLTDAQVGADSRLRFVCELVWGGIWDNSLSQSIEGYGEHDIEVRFRNGIGQSTLLWSERVDRELRVVVDFPATDVNATVGPNTIEIYRLGPNPPNTSMWVQFDFCPAGSG